MPRACKTRAGGRVDWLARGCGLSEI